MNIAVITGASSGIGYEFATQIERKHKLDEIWLIARRKEQLERLSKSLHTQTRILCCDLTDEASFTEYKQLLSSIKPNIKYLFNAAGYGEMGDYEEIALKVQMNMIDLNVKALVRMSVLSIPYMKKGAKILQMGSESVFTPLPYFNIYASTKSFVKHYSKGLYYELKPKGITVTVVCPGWVRTEFFNHTKDNAVKRSPKAYKPMLEAKGVVALAIKDADNGKSMSVCGAYTKLHHAISKIAPEPCLINTWLGLLKEKDKQ